MPKYLVTMVKEYTLEVDAVDYEEAEQEARDTEVNFWTKCGDVEYEVEMISDEPLEGDITTEDHEHWYSYGKLVVEGDEHDVRAYMEKSKFWPDVWWISDHGNAHRITDFWKDTNKAKEEHDAQE